MFAKLRLLLTLIMLMPGLLNGSSDFVDVKSVPLSSVNESSLESDWSMLTILPVGGWTIAVTVTPGGEKNAPRESGLPSGAGATTRIPATLKFHWLVSSAAKQ